MRPLTAEEAKNGLGELMGLVRARPLVVANDGHPVVVVMAVDGFGGLNAIEEENARPVAAALHKP